MKIKFSPRAERDLAQIINNPSGLVSDAQAERYVEDIIQKIQQLREFPESGNPREELFPGARSLMFKSHIIFYVIDNGFIEVLTIQHGHSDVSQIWKMDPK